MTKFRTSVGYIDIDVDPSLPTGWYSAGNYTPVNTTSAIQQAVNAASANTNGGVVIVPAGDWTFDSQIVLPNFVTLIGAGPRSTRIVGTAAVPVILAGTAVYAASPVHNQISIRDMRLDGDFTGGGIQVSSVQNVYLANLDIRCGGSPSPFGIQLINETRYALVERCDVRGADWCYRIEDGGRSDILYMCRARCIAGTNRNGVYIGGTVAGCSNTVVDFTEVAGFGGIGIHIDGGTLAQDQIQVRNCRLESSQPGTPPAIQTDGSLVRPFGFNNYFGSGAAVTNVQDNAGNWEQSQYNGLEPEIRYVDNFQPSTFRRIKTGSGSPEGAVVGSVGDLYMRSDGGAGTTMYVKESGTSTNTGWVAK